MERYKCIVTVGHELLTFKRYGENEETVKNELTSFINDTYGITCHIESIEKDKTHSIKPEDN